MSKPSKGYVPPDFTVKHPDNSNLSTAVWLNEGEPTTCISSRWFNATRTGFKFKNWNREEITHIVELLILTLLKLDVPVSPHLQAYLDELSKTRAST